MSKYISLENLERYDAKMQERTASFCASKEDGMWRQTEKAGAVSFWPVGNSPLEGTVEFMFKETPPASGTKSPDNPSTISGVSSIGLTVCQEEGVDEHSYSLSLGGTYYGGSIDLATGLMTVTQGRVVLYGETIFSTSGFAEKTDCYIIGYYAQNKRTWHTADGVSGFASDKFEITASAPSSGKRIRPVDNSIIVHLSFNKADIGIGDGESYNIVSPAAKAWLATNNVQFVYPLATPQTVQLSPLALRALIQPDKYVPRLNTVYTDADSVQIVYQKNPVRDKFEKVQAIIAQGGNV